MNITFRCDPALIDSLERPRPGREALPDWLRTMPSKAFSDLKGKDVRTVKQCPPVVDAMSHGFVIPLPCDVTMRGGKLSWSWDLPRPSVKGHARSPLSFHVPAQVEGTPWHRTDRAIVKFNSFWTIELEAGWSLYATHPVNRDDLPFRSLTGLVDCDLYKDVGVLFPAMWTDPDFEGILPRGTPVAQCFAVPRVAPTLAFETLSSESLVRHDETAHALRSQVGVYRKTFRARRPNSDLEIAPETPDVEP